jgi:hypothetical protein
MEMGVRGITFKSIVVIMKILNIKYFKNLPITYLFFSIHGLGGNLFMNKSDKIWFYWVWAR